ncbi:MAG: phosphodiester glycosidase family protein [Candidatus Nanopelagicales bacterium]
MRDSVGRGAVLLRDGRVITDCSGDDRPRTAIGWDDRGRTWIITAQEGDRIDVIGGARMGGTTNFQMAQWLHQLGATEGVTLDGGGSTDLEVRTSAGLHRADLPDNAFARLVPNGLIMVPKG